PTRRDLHTFPTRRSSDLVRARQGRAVERPDHPRLVDQRGGYARSLPGRAHPVLRNGILEPSHREGEARGPSRRDVVVAETDLLLDRKSTRLNSSHEWISY